MLKIINEVLKLCRGDGIFGLGRSALPRKWSRRPPSREGNRDAGSLSGLAFRSNRSFVGFDYRLSYSQAQPEASGAARPRRVTPAKPFEDLA